jgi:SAM-dependent methyltransferase
VLRQRYKDICFLALSKATLPNYWAHKLFPTARLANHRPRHLHLGCGPKYLPGFVNIDANPLQKPDLWLDVRCGLPFAADSVDSIYSTHMIEHFYPDELGKLFLDCARILKPGGGLRLIVPSLLNAILAYQEKQYELFYDSFLRYFDSLG